MAKENAFAPLNFLNDWLNGCYEIKLQIDIKLRCRNVLIAFIELGYRLVKLNVFWHPCYLILRQLIVIKNTFMPHFTFTYPCSPSFQCARNRPPGRSRIRNWRIPPLPRPPLTQWRRPGGPARSGRGRSRSWACGCRRSSLEFIHFGTLRIKIYR